MPEPLYMKTKNFSQLLGISADTVRSQCKAGKIPGAKRFGGTWLIPMAYVESYVPPEVEKQPRQKPEELKILKKSTVHDEVRKRLKAK